MTGAQSERYHDLCVRLPADEDAASALLCEVLAEGGSRGWRLISAIKRPEADDTPGRLDGRPVSSRTADRLSWSARAPDERWRDPAALLGRHQSGDWGEIPPEDVKNDISV